MPPILNEIRVLGISTKACDQVVNGLCRAVEGGFDMGELAAGLHIGTVPATGAAPTRHTSANTAAKRRNMNHLPKEEQAPLRAQLTPFDRQRQTSFRYGNRFSFYPGAAAPYIGPVTLRKGHDYGDKRLS